MPRGIGNKKILFKGGTLAYCLETICLHIFSAAIILTEATMKIVRQIRVWKKKNIPCIPIPLKMAEGDRARTVKIFQ